MYVGAGTAGPEGVLGTIVFSRFCLLTVMWSESSSGGSDVTPGHAEYRDALIHVINGLSGASHFLHVLWLQVERKLLLVTNRAVLRGGAPMLAARCMRGKG